MTKPFYPSCANNQQPILEILRRVFASVSCVLEIGSGTGQHAVYFGAHLPHLVWQTSDLATYHAGIRLWVDDAGLGNVRQPLLLDVNMPLWPELQFDAAFSANTAHVMPWAAVEAMFRGLGERLPRDGLFALYGPFNYGGTYTSEGNARLDRILRSADPGSGIRDFEAIDVLADDAGFTLSDDHAMPANNRLIIWRRR